MKQFLTHLLRLDWIIVASSLLLAGTGLMSLRSIALARGDLLNFQKQAIFLGMGVVIMFGLSFFDWRVFRGNPYLILALYFLCLLGLAGLFFFAQEIRGVKTWYRIAGISLDPVEPMKFVLIILLAKYFSMRHVEMYRVQHIVLSGFYISLPAVLMFLQPNMGPVLIITAIWIGILLVSGIKLRHFFLLCLLGILLFAFGWQALLKDYQKERIISFIAPQTEPLGAGWSQTQARIAIGSGGLFGQGFGRGSQTQYGFLPEPHNDFIFSAIAEETGLIGAGFVLLLFCVLLWRILKIAKETDTNFSRLLSFGIATHFACEVFVNVGMNLGMLPIIGIPLPFVSYGGSALVAGFAYLGILQSIKAG